MLIRTISSVAAVGLLLTGCSGGEPARAPLARHDDVLLQSEVEVVEARVPEHATLESLLRQHHLQSSLITSAIEAARGVFNPRDLRADQPYKLVRSLDGLLEEFEYRIDADRFLRIVGRDRERPESLDAEVIEYEKTTSTVAVQGVIDAGHSSLIAAIDETGENVQLAMALADVFSGQIDFEHDLQPGDRFRVVFEKQAMKDGEFAGYGAILGASFEADGHEHQAFRWSDRASGKSAYYDADGRSLKRFFLASPLRFTPRITSGFSRHRLHPIYREYRAHLGVDYGAHTGDPVVAVAAGTVLWASRKGANGNMVHLRHANGYETYYLHLSAFGPGIRPGVHVDQSQLIGRVGMTGAATGPHLDYRLKKNGVFVNPILERRRLPPGEPIPRTELAAFFTARDNVRRQLSTTVLAAAAPAKPSAPDAVSAVR